MFIHSLIPLCVPNEVLKIDGHSFTSCSHRLSHIWESNGLAADLANLGIGREEASGFPILIFT